MMAPAVPAPPVAQAAPSTVAAYPLPSTVIVTCAIAPDETTRDCATDPDPDHPGAAQAVLASLAGRPLHLPGAPAGRTVTIGLIRANLGKVHAGGPKPDKPYKAQLLPLGPEVARYYPERAMRMNASGRSLVSCKVTDQGRLDECWLRAETPPGFDFGLAEIIVATRVVRAAIPGPDAPAYDWRTCTLPMNWNAPQPDPITAPKP